MDCNKEEAIRAKLVAESKMQTKDFGVARKIAIKAQQLYPDLENISQMIMVCDVHCSAENKVFGNEKDWYGILQIQPTADEASIKKQYRKFALLLHPDKNNFAGAADAFKLIGEAQRVLLDREKRMLHDSKCKTSKLAPNWAPQQGSSNPNVRSQPWVQNHRMSKPTAQFTGISPQYPQAQRQNQPAVPKDRRTFWTVCPYCHVKYQYYRDVVNKLLSCQTCKRSFTGYEVNAEAKPPGTNSSGPAFPQEKEVTNEGPFKANLQGSFGDSAPKVGSEVGGGSKRFGKSVVKESKSSDRINGKKRKQVEESSESCDSGSSSDSDDDVVVGKDGNVLAKENFGSYGEYPRRSSRSKPNISYNENLGGDDENLVDDDDHGSPLKRANCSGAFQATEQEEEGSLQDGKKETKAANREVKVTNGLESSEANDDSSLNSSPTVATDPEIYEYPDPDFSDFDKDRREVCFEVGQIWAVYDTLDAMPRFYARISKVFSPGFKLKISWLEPDPDDEDEIKWVEEGLPASCGKFKHGNPDTTEDHPMFSHLIHWEKDSRRNTYKIYPRKGETWALFKNWEITWHSVSDSNRKYEYEFVEVLSDYAEGVGVSVVYLGKLRGFSCLFCRTGKEETDSFLIPQNQLFRFSHRVPSFQMTGEERKDVPKGSFELDPACLPTNVEEIDVSEDLKVETESMHFYTLRSESPAEVVKPMAVAEGNASVCKVNKSQLHTEHMDSDYCTEDPHATPEPEFYNFGDAKFPEKFQVGQIWALYGDEDGLPKYYAQIKKIESQPEFKLHITWLVPSPLRNTTIQWLDKNMPICCGRFKLDKGSSKKYTETAPFSHQLRTEHTLKKDEYVIFPRKREVWALYKNWNAGISSSVLENCEYDIVEILEKNDLEIEVSVLEMVKGFKTVFKVQIKEGSTVTMKFPLEELLRFSHQIPAFALTEERGGSLRGYWELDPAAIPVILFCSS